MISGSSHSTFLSVAPRFVVHDLEQALAFYGQPGFHATYHDEQFAIVEGDGDLPAAAIWFPNAAHCHNMASLLNLTLQYKPG